MVTHSFVINYFFDKLPLGFSHFREVLFHKVVWNQIQQDNDWILLLVLYNSKHILNIETN
jgi:hypothetical protein